MAAKRRRPKPASTPSSGDVVAPAPPEAAWRFYVEGERRRFREELDALGATPAAALTKLMARHVRNETRAGQHFKFLGDGLWELRIQQGTDPYRVIYFRWGHVFVALTAFYKNQQKTPERHLSAARTRRASWLATMGDRPPK